MKEIIIKSMLIATIMKPLFEFEYFMMISFNFIESKGGKTMVRAGKIVKINASIPKDLMERLKALAEKENSACSLCGIRSLRQGTQTAKEKYRNGKVNLCSILNRKRK
jgi:hypothetical protein